MPSKINIYNSALYALGSNAVASETERSREANLCNHFYEIARKKTLSAFPWSFAVTVSEELAENTDIEDEVWAHAYALPSDFLRVLGARISINSNSILASLAPYTNQDYYNVGVDPIFFEVREGYLYTNYEDVKIKYIKNVTDPALFTESFALALSQKLAALMAMALTGKQQKWQAMEQAHALSISEAKAQDSKQGKKRLSSGYTYINSRRVL